PVLFCIENNGYGLSTPIKQQYNCEHLADRGKGYGMEAHIVNGNNILEVYTTVKKLAAQLREKPRPVLLEFKTFRMRGHEEASGTKYVPEELTAHWGERDPLLNFESFLLNENILGERDIETYRNKITDEINSNLNSALAGPEIRSTVEAELKDVFAPAVTETVAPTTATEELRFVDAVSQGLEQAMQYHKNSVVMGQDIAEYGGVFKITEGFLDAFGKARVRNTPICESAIVSAAMGLSINGFKAIVEMQFADFVTSGFNPIINYLAKSHYRWGQPADVVVRMPCGAGVGAGPFHSQTNEAWFTHTPGLKVVYPAFPYDAKGLLTASIKDPNPVLFFEHKALYRTIRQQLPVGYYALPLGKASLLRSGKDVSIITYGAGVHWAIKLLNENPAIHADLLDLRTLSPLDTAAIFTSVKKTGKVLLLQEDSMFGGMASDISALISEHCFEYLDAPIKRVASIETPIPFAKNLEDLYLPVHRLKAEMDQLLAY
ncbi:MAG: transketolase C-terminal domain-containing protein, partial [Marinirhabdus sp.]